MLLPRFLTALVGVPLLVVTIWWGQFPFTVLMFGVMMLALFEYYTLFSEVDWPIFKKVGLICGSLCSASFFLFGTRLAAEKFARAEIFLSPAVMFVFLILLLFTALFSKNKENVFFGVAVTWVGIYYVVWTLSHLFLIRDLRPDGMLFTFFLFFVIWSLDIGAYFGGVKFGKHKLAESVSPKKTWEGVCLGSCAAMLAAFLCHKIFLRSIGMSQSLWLGFLIVILAQVSDLSESLLKRNLQVKDSGALLPGHGGLLDRFDSFLLTSPVYYYALVFFVVK